MDERLSKNLASIRERMAAACLKAERSIDDIKLIAVSKTHPVPVLSAAIKAGVTVFGENKVQEAEGKIVELRREAAEWHLIGHLQSNKARRAVQLFDVIHTLDSVELAERLERICGEEGRDRLDVLIQVDLGDEETKAGAEEDDLASIVERSRALDRLKLRGLMTLPPYFENPDAVRPYFIRLRELRDKFVPGGELSMGMSHDFEVAIEEGATMIRVGTAIFGER
jgi:pyridoxal phosphate enzyme (YggS family)